MRPEVEVVGENRTAVGSGPLHQCRIRRSRIAHLGPVHRPMSGGSQQWDPFGRKVHVDQEPGHQLITSPSSRSSRRQAA